MIAVAYRPARPELSTDVADWREGAVCREEDPELFHPVGTKGPALAQAAEAKAVCRLCPVRGECLTYALEHAVDGVWGGTTEDERRELKRRL